MRYEDEDFYNHSDRRMMILASDEIRQAIVDGRLRNGEILYPDAIVEHYGVSVPTATAIISQLRDESLVRKEASYEHDAVNFHTHEVMTLGQQRLRLEMAAIRYSARRPLNPYLSRCSRSIRTCKASDQIRPKLKSNVEALIYLYACVDNESDLKRIGITIRRFSKYLICLWRDERCQEEYLKDIKMIVKLCKANDVEGAAEMVGQHISKITTAILAELGRRERESLSAAMGPGRAA